MFLPLLVVLKPEHQKYCDTLPVSSQMIHKNDTFSSPTKKERANRRKIAAAIVI